MIRQPQEHDNKPDNFPDNLRNVKAFHIRKDFVELAKLGYGKLVGSGNKLKLVLNTVNTAVNVTETEILN